MKEENKNEEAYGFITSGIYKPIDLKSNAYNIDDLIPVIENKKQKLIGEGRFSKVYLYKNQNNNLFFALKKISINSVKESGNNPNIIQREIDIHSRILHDNIVQLYSVKKEINEVSILLEYCKNGSIYELISQNGFDEYKTYIYFSQVVNAIYFLHKNNLVHRDIKPENILLNSDKIKICDFGWCCEANSNNRKSFCGTFEYMAPEIINEVPYGKPVDIWALGILLYELYYGVSPFSSGHSKEVINNILNYRLNFPGWKNISNDMKDLIIRMLNPNVLKRYTIEEVASHPWFKKCREEFNNKNKINFPIIDSSRIKVTKINKNKNRYNSNLINEVNEINLRLKKKENNTKHNDNNNNNLTQRNVKVRKLINIDMNTTEDNSSPIKKDKSIEKDNYFNKNNIKNIIDSNYKKEKKEIFGNDKKKYENNLNTNKINIFQTNNSNNNINNNKIKANNIKDIIFNKSTIIYNNLNREFSPMDSVLEETNNDKNENNLNLIQKHATVTKISNNSNNNNKKENLTTINLLTQNNKGINTYNENQGMNNYFLNNNFYTINYYTGFDYNNIRSNNDKNNDLVYSFPFIYTNK